MAEGIDPTAPAVFTVVEVHVRCIRCDALVPLVADGAAVRAADHPCRE